MLRCQHCRRPAAHTLTLLRGFPHSPQTYNGLKRINTDFITLLIDAAVDFKARM
jgi:hypothetical protein